MLKGDAGQESLMVDGVLCVRVSNRFDPDSCLLCPRQITELGNHLLAKIPYFNFNFT